MVGGEDDVNQTEVPVPQPNPAPTEEASNGKK
jgi:hypothetical protein